MNGRLIPHEEVKVLPIGTKTLLHLTNDPTDDFWAVCTIADLEGVLVFKDLCHSIGCLMRMEELDKYCEVYEYDEKDAIKHVEEEYRTPAGSKKTEPEQPRYILDKDHMVILDTKKNCIVCLVDTRRPDLFDKKMSELLELANR